jgi:large subunit ribosomal protein L10
MLTKTQKKQHISTGAEIIKGSQALVFTDFSGVDTASINKLKALLKTTGAKFKVFKKRLLKLAFKDAGIDFDPTQYESQLGTVFSENDLSSVAGTVYKFSKDLAKTKKDFKILGAYDLVDKSYLDATQFTAIAKLPTREILLAQVMSGATGPLRALMYLILELSKKQPATKDTQTQTVETQ